MKRTTWDDETDEYRLHWYLAVIINPSGSLSSASTKEDTSEQSNQSSDQSGQSDQSDQLEQSDQYVYSE